jgi:phage-related protein
MLAPVILQVANILMTALQPILTVLPSILTPLLSLITGISAIFVQLAAQILSALLPALQPLIQAVLSLAVALAPLVSALLPVLLPLIKGLGSVITSVLPIITALVGIVAKNLASAINNIAIPAIKVITALLRGDFSGAMNAAKSLVRGVATFFVDSFRNIVKGVSAALKQVISVVKKVPGQARSALGSIGSFLYNSGRALLQGFINGIKSLAGSVKNAVKGVLSSARNLLPFSPAKEGPFSGRGYTTYSGAALMQGFAEGIRSQEGLIRQQLASTLGNAQMSLTPDINSPGLAQVTNSPARNAGRDLTFGPRTTSAPTVTVMIGNRVIDQYVDVRIGQNNQIRDRQTAQGIRR